MAATAQGAILTEAHRQAQVAISASTASLMIRLWPLLNAEDDESINRWLGLVLSVIRGQGAMSARMSATYLSRFRSLEIPDVRPFDIDGTPILNQDQITTSLMVTGPQAVRKALAEFRARENARSTTFTPQTDLPSTINQKIAANSARAAQRHVLNAGRDVIDRNVARDQVARGFVRVTDGDPCFFCAMLASRGPVFKDYSFEDSDPRFQGPGNQKVHDGCGCTIEPVYRGDTKWPGRAKEFEDLWLSSTAGLSGDAARLAFRRAFEGRSKD